MYHRNCVPHFLRGPASLARWTHGKHHVRYKEIALRQDQAEYAASSLHRSATYLMAVAMKDTIRAAVSDPKSSPNQEVRAAYQIARLIRNAFAHSPFLPMGPIDPDCRDSTFNISNVIMLNTSGLDGAPFEWRHSGGPLALSRLCRFVRIKILGDQPQSWKFVPIPGRGMYQQGNLILRKVEAIPSRNAKSAR